MPFAHHIWAAHHIHVTGPIAIIRGGPGIVEDTLRDFATHAAKLAPNGHWRSPDLLELADAPWRGECDVAPIHLLDPETGTYNRTFLSEGLQLLEGYTRMQGVVTRSEETRETAEIAADPSLRMVNRNQGSGTRILIDQLLGSHRPDGHAHEPRSHHAVAAAVAQGRADWGVCIETVARDAGLRFQPLATESYDFVIPSARRDRPAVRALRQALEARSPLRAELEALGFGSPA